MKEAAEIKKIPCAVCRDLMPLVQDGVASPESEALVKAHLAACPATLASLARRPCPLHRKLTRWATRLLRLL